MAPKPPQIVTQDSTGHEIEESSDDHFSSASEGAAEPRSPIPLTRVERVDDIPSYGEVPGTPSYAKRTADAVPDEVEIVPDGLRSRSGTRSRAMSNLSLSETPSPSGPPIPKTVVERVDDKPAHGEVEGTKAHEKRLADAEPDEMKQVEDIKGSLETSIVSPQSFFHDMWEGKQKEADRDDEEQPPEEEVEDAGDDFDDFAEGDDDFGDFDEADETPIPEPQPTPQTEAPNMLADLPVLDFSSDDRRRETVAAYLEAILPDEALKRTTNAEAQAPTAFLSERSLSLWQQLVSPPPMQPPDWTRSRIRRLFLVSLGVPVNLDEILPPSKQKRLVLPNINLASSPRASSVMERLRDSAVNVSTTSIDSKSGAPKPHKTKRAIKGPQPPPEFDLNAAAMICNTTVEALNGFEDAELKDHLFTLEILNKKSSSVLEYWLVRKDESVKEKEALEGVIENLVGFVKGRRGK